MSKWNIDHRLLLNKYIDLTIISILRAQEIYIDIYIEVLATCISTYCVSSAFKAPGSSSHTSFLAFIFDSLNWSKQAEHSRWRAPWLVVGLDAGGKNETTFVVPLTKTSSTIISRMSVKQVTRVSQLLVGIVYLTVDVLTESSPQWSLMKIWSASCVRIIRPRTQYCFATRVQSRIARDSRLNCILNSGR